MWVGFLDFQTISLMLLKMGVLFLITPDKALLVPCQKAFELFPNFNSPPSKSSLIL